MNGLNVVKEVIYSLGEPSESGQALLEEPGGADYIHSDTLRHVSKSSEHRSVSWPSTVWHSRLTDEDDSASSTQSLHLERVHRG